MSAQPILQENFPFLRQKICLMALIEAVFKRPTSDRVLPFSVIASETRVPADEVEILVMKALSSVAPHPSFRRTPADILDTL